MQIQAAHRTLVNQLSTIYDEREAANIADWVVGHITNLTKTMRVLHKNRVLDDGQLGQLQTISYRLLQHEPVQYVLNEAWFGGMGFYVDNSVLIPRPETEELVDWVVLDARAIDKTGISLFDIGTGSGCIPIALKNKLPTASITSIDISEKALEVANKNARMLSAEINLLQMDFLDECNWEKLGKFDIIISNPPYIKQQEKANMKKNVLENEPSLALFVFDEDPLLFYQKIALFAKSHLEKDGLIYVEINEALGEETIGLFKNHGYATQLKQDLQGKDRMVKAWLD